MTAWLVDIGGGRARVFIRRFQGEVVKWRHGVVEYVQVGVGYVCIGGYWEFGHDCYLGVGIWVVI